MSAAIPKNQPQHSQQWAIKELNAALKKFGQEAWDGKSLIIFGCEAYYLLMGNSSQNDRGIYDDAMFVLSERVFLAVNANLDPKSNRPGHGYGDKKGMGTIHYGCFKDSYAIGKHRTIYPALRQVGAIVVRRDADSSQPIDVWVDDEPYYFERGDHQAMNIHPGGINTTSSLGCQTIPRAQWPVFINTVVSELKRLGQKRVTYVKDRVRG